MPTTLTTAIGGRVADRRASRQARRARRARRDRLRAELASYSTPAERAELEAMFERHTDEEVAQLIAMVR
jgi:hypothetical protein